MSAPKGRGLFDEDDDASNDQVGVAKTNSSRTPSKNRQSINPSTAPAKSSFSHFRPSSVGTSRTTTPGVQQKTQKRYATSALAFKPSVIANRSSGVTSAAIASRQSDQSHKTPSHISNTKHMSSSSISISSSKPSTTNAAVDNLTFDDSFEDEYDPRKPNDYEQMLEEQARAEQVKKNQEQLKVQMVEQQKQQEQLSDQRKQEALERIAAGRSATHMSASTSGSGMGRGRGRGRGMLVPAWLEAQQREQREKGQAGGGNEEGGSVRGGLQSSSIGNQEQELVVLVLKNVVYGVSALAADIVDDVREECQTHGTVTGVRAIHSDRDESVDLAVLYVVPQSAEAARAALHGRFFAGRQLDATVAPEHIFMQAQLINF